MATLKNFIKVLRREIILNSTVWIYTIVSFLSLTLLAFIISIASHSGQSEDFFSFWYNVGLIMGNIFVSISAFRDLRLRGFDVIYISMPVSTFQKWFSVWLLTFVGYFLVFTAAFYLFLLIIVGVSAVFGLHIGMPQIFTPNVLEQIKNIYPLINALFLLGAIVFKRYVFLLTASISIGIIIIINLFFVLFAWIYLKITLGGITPLIKDISSLAIGFSDFEFSNNPMKNYILDFILWTASFFKLKEKQLK